MFAQHESNILIHFDQLLLKALLDFVIQTKITVNVKSNLFPSAKKQAKKKIKKCTAKVSVKLFSVNCKSFLTIFFIIIAL